MYRLCRTVFNYNSRDDPRASIGAYLLPRSGDAEKATALRLEYTITNGRTREKTAHDYSVSLKYSKCNFGGERPWFRCPECDSRQRKLSLPPRVERFACREYYDLRYTTSRTSGDDVKQAELRYRRAFAKVDAENRRTHPNSEPWLPDRPKGMHHDTYEDLVQDIRTAYQEWEDAMRIREQELIRKLQ